MQALKFKNFSDEQFIHTYDSVPYTFEAGQEIFLEDYKAYHFAKHLVDRELNKLNIVTNNMSERARLGELCFPKEAAVTPLEAIQINEKAKEKKKVSKKKVEEEEFSDLNK